MFKRGESTSAAVAAETGAQPVAPKPRATKPEPTPIGPSFRIKGEISGNQDLVVHGHVEGRIDLGDGLLLVTRDGRVDADVSARVITVEGRAAGDLRASEQIIVRRSARVHGSVSAPRVALDFGCAFSGAIDTEAHAAPADENGDDKVADFKAAIAGTAQGGAKSSPR